MPHRTALRPDVVESLQQSRVGGRPGRLGVPHLFDLSEIPAAEVALVVVDMQEEFFAPIPMNHEIVGPINTAAAALRGAGGRVCWITSDVGPDALENWSVMYDHHFGSSEQAVKAKLRSGGTDFGREYDPMAAEHGMDGACVWPRIAIRRAARPSASAPRRHYVFM
eukprot:SAG22_NODE_258_length_13522_cov_6.989496_5_plen_166_part_00